MISQIYSKEELSKRAKLLFEEERKIDNLTGWFLAVEKSLEVKRKNSSIPLCRQASLSLVEVAKSLPLLTRLDPNSTALN